MAVSRQAYKLDKERIRLETKVRGMEKEFSRRMRERMKLKDEVKELKNLAKELKVDIMEKDTCLNHLHKQNDELRSSLSKSRDEVIKEFKTSTEFTVLLDKNYTIGFENFCMDAIESFPGVDLILSSSLLQLRVPYSR